MATAPSSVCADSQGGVHTPCPPCGDKIGRLPPVHMGMTRSMRGNRRQQQTEGRVPGTPTLSHDQDRTILSKRRPVHDKPRER